jgi:hypothetical protein
MSGHDRQKGRHDDAIVVARRVVGVGPDVCCCLRDQITALAPPATQWRPHGNRSE